MISNFLLFGEIGGGLVIPTGIKIALPEGYLALVLPRSGLAAKEGISVLNTPGLIDSDYRGEIFVNLINFSKKPFLGKRGMRIAQLLILQYSRIVWEEVEQLPQTERGEGGWEVQDYNLQVFCIIILKKLKKI